MKNPLKKRYLRELKQDFGKYLVIFLFQIMLISMVSGYLVVASSIEKTFNEGLEKYNIEDGHITFSNKPDKEVLEEIENKAELTFYNLEYFDEKINGSEIELRVYKNRNEVNTACLMEGELPKEKSEIALDRLFAVNAGIQIGDTLGICGKEYTVTGIVALVDYSCMFKKNTDMMFNAYTFGVGLMSEEGFEATDSEKVAYNYAFKYDKAPENEAVENERSEDLIDTLATVLEDYNTELVTAMATDFYQEAALSGNPEAYGEFKPDEAKLLLVDDYVPKYKNKAITYCMDDMGSDKPMFILFDYIVVAILAFVFAITISNTIAAEAGAIGTLRALGFTRGELVRHYLFIPIMVTIVASIVGNILGYTVFVNNYRDLMYNSFSLATYESFFNLEAFVYTTVIPLILMFLINLYVLSSKLKLSPIKFLRRDLKTKVKRRAMLLNRKLPFMLRFRLRILFQNIPAYITLALGIIFGGMIAVFGWMFMPLLDDYEEMILDTKVCEYQYILKEGVETDAKDAEKYCVTGLDSTFEGYLVDDISVYGIEEESKYILSEIPEGEVLVTDAIAEKFRLKAGDTLTLKEPYSDTLYEFTIGGIYTVHGSLNVYMNRAEFNELFDKSSDYYTGYFANEKIEDIDESKIVSIISGNDMIELAQQLTSSMGGFLDLFQYFGMIMFLALMYLLTKQIIEKNMQSIAMTKILGYRGGEIAGLYLVITSAVVVIALIISVPIIDGLLRLCFTSYLYTELNGYIPYIVSNGCYIKEFILGIGCYAIVSLIMMVKINRISKAEALKNVE